MKNRIIKVFGILFAVILSVFMSGCEKNGGTDVKPIGPALRKELAVGMEIQMNSITDFYYTYENINYNAFYQRYRFYVEDGKYYFFNETREKPDEYGWTTSDDTTKIGTVELTEEQWKDFYEIIRDGTVKAREDNADSGDPGPWYYLYWTSDADKYQVYTFPSYEKEKAFEEYCISLAEGSDADMTD